MLTRVLMTVVLMLLGIVVLGRFILRRNRASGWLLFYSRSWTKVWISWLQRASSHLHPI